ncbi:type III secretion system export apparatus subunit SctT [Halomonas sp. FME1]|uniref:Type III secretion system export apparatus subunit SctT n=1 Tax=Halomonas casei TaxID=2742613 RepID=A0ABR9EY25_9GAMM|nr:type III secretion system export apparatus subunit SctT [Halomonas casei]MBE0398764.1 type III secretion system export apparatus subunit SctT [Halomonas casei]
MAYDELTRILIEQVYPVLVAVAIGMARATGVILITPVFNRLGLTGLIRAAVALTLTIPMVLPILEALSTLGDATAFTIAGLLFKELFIGMLLGMVFGIPFWAAEVAGEVADLQRASTMGQLLDPSGATQSSVTSTLLVIMLVALFFGSGGFLVLLDGFYSSYSLWPVEAFMPTLETRTALAMLGFLDQVMRVGILMVAPLVIAMLVADLMLAYLARMAPTLNMFILSLPIKNLLFTFLMVLYLVFLVPQMFAELGMLDDYYRRFESLVGSVP